MNRGIGRYIINFVFATYLFLNGCAAAALPVMVGVGVAAGVTAIVMVVNLARDQYPDIDFDKPAPVAVIYSNSYENVWNGIIDTLMEMKESPAMMDKSSGVIRTVKKNINDVSWIGKGLGKATFLYELNITVRKERTGVSVAATIPFWEEKVFIAAKEKNLPEGSNMMRHIFYRNLNNRLSPAFVRLPDSPTQDIRYSPMNKEVQPPAPVSPTRQSPLKGGDSKITKSSKQSEIKIDDKLVEPKAPELPNKIITIKTSVDVKNKPDIKAKSIGRVNAAEDCEQLDEKGDWIKVRLLSNANIVGWIQKCHVKDEKVKCPQSPKGNDKKQKELKIM